MRGFKWACLFISSIAAPVLLCIADPPPPADHPTYWVWSSGVPCTYAATPQDYLKQLVIDINLVASDNGTASGNRVADYIIDHTRLGTWRNYCCDPNNPNCNQAVRSPDLGADSIAVALTLFGRDHPDCDGTGPYRNAGFRFFRDPEDRLAYFPPQGVPIPECPDEQFNFPAPSDPELAYRHPFLWNAGYREDVRGPGPLKIWTVERLDCESRPPIPNTFFRKLCHFAGVRANALYAVLG